MQVSQASQVRNNNICLKERRKVLPSKPEVLAHACRSSGMSLALENLSVVMRTCGRNNGPFVGTQGV